MFLPPSWLQTLREWSQVLLPILLFLGAIWKRRWLRRKMRTAWHTLTGAESLGERLHALSAVLTEALEQLRTESASTRQLTEQAVGELRRVRAELQPNGGGSLHDVVQAIAAAQRARDDRDAEPLFWADAEGRLTHVNRAYLSMSGRTREELVGTGWTNFIVPTDRARVLERWREAVREARDFDEVFSVQEVRGHWTYQVHGRATRLLGTSGRLLGYYGELQRVG